MTPFVLPPTRCGAVGEDEGERRMGAGRRHAISWTRERESRKGRGRKQGRESAMHTVVRVVPSRLRAQRWAGGGGRGRGRGRGDRRYTVYSNHIMVTPARYKFPAHSAACCTLLAQLFSQCNLQAQLFVCRTVQRLVSSPKKLRYFLLLFAHPYL